MPGAAATGPASRAGEARHDSWAAYWGFAKNKDCNIGFRLGFRVSREQGNAIPIESLFNIFQRFSQTVDHYTLLVHELIAC